MTSPQGSDATDLPLLPMRYRPFGVRYAAFLFGALLFATLVVIGFAFDPDTRSEFTVGQVITVVVLFGAVLVVLYAMGRSRVDATEDGMVVVNGFRRRPVAWPEVVRLSLRSGAPWLVLDLADGTTMSVLAVQGSDGNRAHRQVIALRALVEHYSATPRND